MWLCSYITRPWHLDGFYIHKLILRADDTRIDLTYHIEIQFAYDHRYVIIKHMKLKDTTKLLVTGWTYNRIKTESIKNKDEIKSPHTQAQLRSHNSSLLSFPPFSFFFFPTPKWGGGRGLFLGISKRENPKAKPKNKREGQLHSFLFISTQR